MTEAIRNLRVQEFVPFMRFLERSYGASPGEFQGFEPDLYRPTPEACAASYVIEREGQIVSHVALFPLELVSYGVTIPLGGIGGVGTLPSERGRGHMTRLLYHVIDQLREGGYALSWLGGDRQRYNAFGWERAGLPCHLEFSRRSLDRAGAEAIEIEARFPSEAREVIERLQSLPACHARRPRLALQLQKEGLRVWTAADGYAMVRGSLFGSFTITELASASGQELGMIRALLDWTERDKITWMVAPCDDACLARVMPGVSGWRVSGGDMYRIVDLTQLLTLAAPILSRRAAALRDLKLAIGVREHDRTNVATLVVRDGAVEVAPGRRAERYVEWSSLEAVRTLLGGPPIAAEVPSELATLLPIPVYLPPLDHV